MQEYEKISNMELKNRFLHFQTIRSEFFKTIFF